MSTGLGSYCPAPCASIVLFDMDDVADCSICLAEHVATTALESAYGATPPELPAAAPVGAAASCQKQLASAATGLSSKWAGAQKSCEKDNSTGKNAPAIDCATDPKGKIGKAKDSAEAKVAKCTTFTGLAGCAAGAPDSATVSQCIEDSLDDVVAAYPGVAYP